MFNSVYCTWIVVVLKGSCEIHSLIFFFFLYDWLLGKTRAMITFGDISSSIDKIPCIFLPIRASKVV